MAQEYDQQRIRQIKESSTYMVYFKVGFSLLGLLALALDSWHVEKTTYFIFSFLLHYLFVHWIDQNEGCYYLYAPACLMTFSQFGFNCSLIYQDDLSILMMAYLTVSFYSGVCLSLNWMSTSLAQGFSCALLIFFNLSILDSKT